MSLLSLKSQTITNRIRSQWRKTLRKEDSKEEASGGRRGARRGRKRNQVKEGGGLKSQRQKKQNKTKKTKGENRGSERCELTECRRGILVEAGSRKVSCGACKVSRGYLGRFHMEPGQTPEMSKKRECVRERDTHSERERLLMAKPFTRPHCSEP